MSLLEIVDFALLCVCVASPFPGNIYRPVVRGGVALMYLNFEKSKMASRCS